MIDVERIKKFNAGYKEAQQKAATIKAELDMNNREIDRLCAELSNDLGVSVTRENVAEIYKSNVDEINKKLELGESILNRINNETQGVAVGQQVGNVGVQQVSGVGQQIGAQQVGVQQVGNVGKAGMNMMPNMGMGQQMGNVGQVGNGVGQQVGNQVGQQVGNVGMSQAPVQNGNAVPDSVFGTGLGAMNMFDSI